MTTAPALLEKNANEDRMRMSVKEKWQGAVTDSSGFVAIPTILLKAQSSLTLTPTEMVVLVNLLAHWWDPEHAVFPRSTTIARRMGVTERTVHRALVKMVKAGLIERRYENGRRAFQFTTLAHRLARILGPQS